MVEPGRTDVGGLPKRNWERPENKQQKHNRSAAQKSTTNKLPNTGIVAVVLMSAHKSRHRPITRHCPSQSDANSRLRAAHRDGLAEDAPLFFPGAGWQGTR